MRIGVADYGMNVYEGGLYDLDERLRQLKAIGYEGLEMCPASSPADALRNAGSFRRLGMDFASCSAPGKQTAIEWTAALGKGYVWVYSPDKNFETFCRQVDVQLASCRRWGIGGGLHNHMGTLAQTQEQVEAFLAKCPGSGLILDTAHLAVAGGNSLEIARKYADRLVAVHLKDYVITNPEITGETRWPERGHFCALGKGNIGLDNAAVMKILRASGYDGWVFVEQDVHLQDPLKDLAESREYLRAAGF